MTDTNKRPAVLDKAEAEPDKFIPARTRGGRIVKIAHNPDKHGGYGHFVSSEGRLYYPSGKALLDEDHNTDIVGEPEPEYGPELVWLSDKGRGSLHDGYVATVVPPAQACAGYLHPYIIRPATDEEVAEFTAKKGGAE